MDPEDITWFEDDDYINTEISFPSGSVWRIDTKIREHDYLETKDMEQLGVQYEARGAFLCSKVLGDGPSTAFIRIRLQIPWYGTVQKELSVRAQQATSKAPDNFHSEIKALSHLTKTQCTSTPALLDWKKEQQAEDERVPGGYKLYILMEHIPGSNLENLFPILYDPALRAERDAIRAAFKAAWIETVECGIEHQDPAARNLLWDQRRGKCYLVDWEYWSYRVRDLSGRIICILGGILHKPALLMIILICLIGSFETVYMGRRV